MATTYNPELHDALVSAGSGEGPARAAAESVSREIRESRDDAVKESGRSAKESVEASDSARREREERFSDKSEVRRVDDKVSESLRALAWMKGAIQIMVPVLLATFAAVVVILLR